MKDRQSGLHYYISALWPERSRKAQTPILPQASRFVIHSLESSICERHRIPLRCCSSGLSQYLLNILIELPLT
jgi:hypothetical protein